MTGEQKCNNIENNAKYGHVARCGRSMPLGKAGRDPKYFKTSD